MYKDLWEVYESPEAYFVDSILRRMSGQNTVTKPQLLEAVMQTQVGKREKIGRLCLLTKADLFDLLVRERGEEAFHMFPVGITAPPFQRRFDVTRIELEKLSRLGLVRQTGEYRLRDGTVCKLFSVWDLFHADSGKIREAVEKMREAADGAGD